MTRIRRFFSGVMRRAPSVERDLQREHGALPWAGAVGSQRAAHRPRGERRAVEPEAVPLLLRREAVLEDPGDVLRRDPYAVIAHREHRPGWVLRAGPER